jgi:thiamine biosynthesis protein ThiS
MKDNAIYIIFNGLKEEISSNTTIADYIELTQEKDISLIVEHNKKFVYPQQYASTILYDGDKLEFINPNFGG